MKRLLLLCLLLLPLSAWAADYTVGTDFVVFWTAPTTGGTPTGYKLYVGTETGVYGDPIVLGNVTSYAVSDATPDTYYYAVLAFNGDGDGTLSDEISVEVLGDSADTTDPEIAINSPTAGATYNTSTSTITVGGTASDDTAVTSVSWSNDRGGSGSCDGTTTWSCESIGLYEGENVLTITAADAATNDATDTLTVTYTPTGSSGTLSVSATTRLTHPAYRMSNNHFGTRPYVWSSDNKRLMLWEEKLEYTTSYGTKTGRGLVWGWVADCDSHDCLTEWAGEVDPLAAYESYATPVPGSSTVVKMASCAWSPLAGEENIIYCPIPDGDNTLIRRINVDTEEVTTKSTILGDNEIACWGYDADKKYLCSSSKDDWSAGGWRIDLTTGGQTTVAANYPYSTQANATCNQTPPTINDDGWEFSFQHQNGHGGRNADSTLWANNYGNGDYPGVINTPGIIKRTSDACEVIEDTTRATYNVTHVTLNAWANRYIGSSCGVACNGEAGAPNLDTMKLFVIDFDPVAETYDYTLLSSWTSAGRWSGHLNFEAIPISTINTSGTQIIYNSTGGKYTYEDYLTNSELDWGLEGIYLAELEVSGGEDTTDPVPVITSPTASATFETYEAKIALGGTASDDRGVTSVSWSCDVCGSGTATGTTTWSVAEITLQTGANVITVTATDAAANDSDDVITVTKLVDSTDPEVTITAPTSSATYNTGSYPLVDIGGTASDDVSLDRVEWSNAATGLSGFASGTTTWSVDAINLVSGENAITVTAYDKSGNDASDVITVTYTAGGGGVTDNFEASTEQDIKTGGDGSKSYGWYVLNSAVTDTIDVHTTNSGMLTVTQEYGASSTDAYNSTFSVPYVYKLVTGDFDIETYFDPTPINADFIGGNFIVRDPAASAGEDHIRLALYHNSSEKILTINTTNSSSSADVDTAANHPYLRITRVGNVFTLYSKANSGDSWTQRSEFTRSDFASEVQVGLAVSEIGVLAATTIQFDYFRDNIGSAAPTTLELLRLSWTMTAF